MKEFFKKFHWIISVQFGLDIRRMIWSVRGLPRYIGDWIEFRKNYSGVIGYFPCLHDRYEEGGSTKNEYFWQDLYVAQKIFLTKPERHVDVGSRIDGFVAHVASFREIEVFDIRPITADISGVIFKQADFMSSSQIPSEYCDSLSCLHALEHFGLGRYGDPVDPIGYMAGFSNMARLLRVGGIFYLSVPIGKERVEFNAHRIFNPSSLVDLATVNGLTLCEFAWVESGQNFIQSTFPLQDIERLSKLRYSLGLFTFVKQ